MESGLTPVVFTFRDNPAEYLTGTCCYLTTVEERMRILESWGVEYVIMPDFAQVAEWPAERFANLLRFGLNAKRIACGADFRFGKFAAGDTEWLKKLCEAHGGEMHIVPTVEYKGERVSATRIRKAIENGEMEDVTAMLGRPFGFCFEVVHGNHIGHTIGTPTINQNFPPRFVLPRRRLRPRAFRNLDARFHRRRPVRQNAASGAFELCQGRKKVSQFRRAESGDQPERKNRKNAV